MKHQQSKTEKSNRMFKETVEYCGLCGDQTNVHEWILVLSPEHTRECKRTRIHEQLNVHL